MNRPERFNSLDFKMAEELVRAFEECDADKTIRAVIFTGAGPAFCSGGDLKGARDSLSGDPGSYFGNLTLGLHRLVADIRLMPKPVIAAVNGAAGGAGFSLAMACDLRVASEKAKFKQAYTSVGLVPDGGWTYHVPRFIGAARASELVLLDPVLDAARALELGLVNRVVPPGEVAGAAREWADKLADGPTAAFARAKALLNASLMPNLESQMERERQGIIACGRTADFAEGVTAFFEKRNPSYKGE